MRIYVEIRIRGEIDEIWTKTQTPDVHQRWDLRFSRIEYLPRGSEAEPQRFLYATRIGFGLAIAGTGESVGTIEKGGARTSSLRFGSDDVKSLIREGAGFWKYIPTPDGVRFLTGYDYDARFGALGRAIDRAAFRPLLGWATAWSFDRLRLWVERGLPPEAARAAALVHSVCRGAVAFAWVWHGLVPKLLFRTEDEIALLADAGIGASALPFVGAAEIAMGAATLFFHRARWPLFATIAVMALSLAAVAIRSPRALTAAFTPATLNVALAAAAAAALAALPFSPTARRCLRRPPGGTSE